MLLRAGKDLCSSICFIVVCSTETQTAWRPVIFRHQGHLISPFFENEVEIYFKSLRMQILMFTLFFPPLFFSRYCNCFMQKFEVEHSFLKISHCFSANLNAENVFVLQLLNSYNCFIIKV